MKKSTKDRYVMHFDSNLPGLLNEVLCNPGAAILKIPIQITKNILAELAQLAIEIDDPRLHKMMLRLGLYDVSAAERVEQIKKMESFNPNWGAPTPAYVLAERKEGGVK